MVNSDLYSSDDSEVEGKPDEEVRVIFVVVGKRDELDKFLDLVEDWKWTVRDHRDGKNNHEASATFLLDEATMFIDYLLKSKEAKELDILYGWKQLKGDTLESGFTKFTEMENGLLRSVYELKEKYSYTAVPRHRYSLESEERRLGELEEIRNTKLTVDDLSDSSSDGEDGKDSGDEEEDHVGGKMRNLPDDGPIGVSPPESLHLALPGTPTRHTDWVASGECGPSSPRKKKHRGP